MSQARFQKQQREKQRRERAAAKLARRDERRANPDEAPPPLSADDEAAVLAEIATLHQRYEAGEVSLDDFEDQKAELSERLIR